MHFLVWHCTAADLAEPFVKNVYDTVLILNKYTTNFDWEYISRESRRDKMCTTIFFILSQVKFLLNIHIPKTVGKDLNVPFWKRKLIRQFIKRNTFSSSLTKSNRDLYLRSHFLLYGNMWEPIEYIFKIPKEQFAKYYGFSTYDKKTGFLYQNRLLYIPFRAALNLFNTLSKN